MPSNWYFVIVGTLVLGANFAVLSRFSVIYIRKYVRP